MANLPVEPNFLQWLFTQGPTIIFLAIAIYCVARGLMTQAAKHETARLDQLNDYKVRNLALEARLAVVEKRVDDCEDDRQNLRQEIRDLKTRLDQ